MVSSGVLGDVGGPHREQVVGAEKIEPHADRPGGRGDVERERLLDLVQQVERVAVFAGELVDKVMIGTSRRRHTSNSFLLCSSVPPCCLWGGVE
jgi:coenzyme F420-reducing hydrogenase alpha subunit